MKKKTALRPDIAQNKVRGLGTLINNHSHHEKQSSFLFKLLILQMSGDET